MIFTNLVNHKALLSAFKPTARQDISQVARDIGENCLCLFPILYNFNLLEGHLPAGEQPSYAPAAHFART